MAILKNIIFDLGGVLLNINYQKTSDAFHKLGYDDFEKMYTQYSVDALFENLETGHVSPEEFYKKLQQGNRNNITDEQITEAWNAMLLDFRTESLAYLEKLSKDFKLFLFSNTNEIHLNAFQAVYNEETGGRSLDDLFTKAYYSHRIHLRKPNREGFDHILKDAGIEATETLFIDDSYNNIETAAAMGFKTHLLKPGEKIEDLPYNGALMQPKII